MGARDTDEPGPETAIIYFDVSQGPLEAALACGSFHGPPQKPQPEKSSEAEHLQSGLQISMPQNISWM